MQLYNMNDNTNDAIWCIYNHYRYARDMEYESWFAIYTSTCGIIKYGHFRTSGSHSTLQNYSGDPQRIETPKKEISSFNTNK